MIQLIILGVNQAKLGKNGSSGFSREYLKKKFSMYDGWRATWTKVHMTVKKTHDPLDQEI